MYLNDEDAFWLLYSLFVKYEQKKIYQNVKDVERHIFLYEKLLAKFLPQHLEKLVNFILFLIYLGKTFSIRKNAIWSQFYFRILGSLRCL